MWYHLGSVWVNVPYIYISVNRLLRVRLLLLLLLYNNVPHLSTETNKTAEATATADDDNNDVKSAHVLNYKFIRFELWL